MKQRWKRTLTLVLCGALSLSLLTGCGSLNESDIVLTVGDEEVSAGFMNFYARFQQAEYETYYAGMMGMESASMWTQEWDDDQDFEEYVKGTILETVENLYLIRQHAPDYDIELTSKEEEEIAKAAADFDEANDEESKEAVSGDTEYVKEYLNLITYEAKMEEPMEEGVDLEVTDEEAAQKAMDYIYIPYTSYDEESGDAEDMTDEEKEQLLSDVQESDEDLKSGKVDLEEVADQFGVTSQSCNFDSETTSPNEELIAQADELEEEGDATDVVETDYGLYLGVLTSLFDEDATEEKKESIVEERKQDKMTEVLDSWRDDTTITVDEKVWDKIDFVEMGVTAIESDDEDTDTDE